MNPRKRFIASATFFTTLLIFTIPALAIPVAGDYTLNSTVFNGTFTSNGSELTQWEFVTNPQGSYLEARAHQQPQARMMFRFFSYLMV